MEVSFGPESMTTTEHSFRLRDVTYALGMQDNPIPVRNWLRRRQVRLGGYGEGGWASFTVRDVCALALIRRLVDRGVTVEGADKLISKGLKIFWRDEFDADPDKITFAGGFVSDPDIKAGLPQRIFVYENAEKGGQLAVRWGGERDKIDADSWIAIDVKRVVDEAVARALESIEQRNAKRRA